MKKSRGFTLIELVIGMAATVIILGGIVAVLRGGLGSMLTGQDQATAFANARAVMEDITTTLRYADDFNLNSDGSVTYKYGDDNTISLNGSTPSRTIAWKDSTHKQLVITKDDGTKVEFPSNASNSAFSSDEYKTAFKNVTGNELSDGQIPILANSTDNVYNIILPVKHEIKGTSANKVDVLISAVSMTSGGLLAKADATITVPIDKEERARSVAQILATAFESMQNTSWNTKITNISSIAVHPKKSGVSLAGVSGALWNRVTAADKEYIGNLVWIIAPCNINDEIIGNFTGCDHWKILVARNVVDDVPNADGVRLYDYKEGSTQGLNGINVIKAAAETQGIYYIRPNYGFLTYGFRTEGRTDKIISAGLGYVTAQYTSDLIIINFKKWVSAGEGSGVNNYTALTDSSNAHVEYFNNTKGTYKRIDYNGQGNEYTRDTVVDYQSRRLYPPDMVTGESTKQ